MLAAGIGLGAAVFLTFQATSRMRTVLYSLIDLLAGIPSVYLWLHRSFRAGKAVFEGRGSYRFLRAGSRNSAGSNAASLSDVLLQ